MVHGQASDLRDGAREVTISGQLLVDMLTGGRDVTDDLRQIRCIKGLPKDVRLWSAECVGGTPDLLLTFRSKEWEGLDSLDVVYQESDAGV